MNPENWFFVRGLVRESGHWHDFPTKFAKAFPKKRVHLLDLLGNGVHCQEASPLTVGGLAKGIRADYLRARGDSRGKNFVFALSLGAMVTLEWLREFPEDLSGAVLINTSLRSLNPFYERLLAKNYPTIFRLLFSANILDREREILRMTSNLCPEREKIAREWEEIQRLRPVTRKNAIRQVFAALRFKPPVEKPKPQLLILNGMKDQLVSPQCSERIAALWGSDIRRHPEAGHDLPLDAPEWVIEQLKNWPITPGKMAKR